MAEIVVHGSISTTGNSPFFQKVAAAFVIMMMALVCPDEQKQ
jgi:hypothetical protein